MKFKLLVSSVLMGGALMGSGAASATPVWEATGTLANWENGTMTLTGGGSQSSSGGVGTITDKDGDMAFTANVATALAGGLSGQDSTMIVAITEDEVNGKDLYTVTFSPNFTGGYTGANGATISYNITSLESPINSTSFDSVVVDSVETATAFLPGTGVSANSAPGSSTLCPTPAADTLCSIYGNSIPATGELPTNRVMSIDVVDTLNPSNGINTGRITQVSNVFDVPEPTTLIMLGLGLAAFGYSRRNTMAKGLSA